MTEIYFTTCYHGLLGRNFKVRVQIFFVGFCRNDYEQLISYLYTIYFSVTSVLFNSCQTDKLTTNMNEAHSQFQFEKSVLHYKYNSVVICTCKWWQLQLTVALPVQPGAPLAGILQYFCQNTCKNKKLIIKNNKVA